jgi:hypothetical protein
MGAFEWQILLRNSLKYVTLLFKRFSTNTRKYSWHERHFLCSYATGHTTAHARTHSMFQLATIQLSVRVLGNCQKCVSSDFYVRSHPCEETIKLFRPSVCPSFCTQETAREQLDGFSWNTILRTHSNFGQNWTTMTSSLHEHLHVHFCAPKWVGGEFSRGESPVGKFPGQ